MTVSRMLENEKCTLIRKEKKMGNRIEANEVDIEKRTHPNLFYILMSIAIASIFCAFSINTDIGIAIFLVLMALEAIIDSAADKIITAIKKK
ncbi:MAG: hypothetical protein A2Y82_02645 [Candidatus Buchananbacteria bacterium RBG_13_36_9]|uniref:Uncharacterized protein n=1 Tax=Candidatus Buchananbacteria bacterium RBG_13_36_9 TaxID=1797530 RepID=A0A1G1XP38_9BACT|nr:MAG: hypothetical protein A2Y82_02645 [Candidatus Buchananbacteria bacterium RBG_13_36_9]